MDDCIFVDQRKNLTFHIQTTMSALSVTRSWKALRRSTTKRTRSASTSSRTTIRTRRGSTISTTPRLSFISVACRPLFSMEISWTGRGSWNGSPHRFSSRQIIFICDSGFIRYFQDVFETKDEIEEVNRKLLEKLLDENEFVAVYFCKFASY